MVGQTKTKWCIPVTKTLDADVEEAVSRGRYSSKAEFVREAVRRQLEAIGFKPQVSEKFREDGAEPSCHGQTGRL